MKTAKSFIELDKKIHQRADFQCGQQSIDVFLKQYAVKHRHAGISKTMVLPAKDDSSFIFAFYTLSHTEIRREHLPDVLSKKLPRYPIPVLLIGQLAVNNELQGQGLGQITLVQALKYCLKINRHLPSYAIIVDAIDSNAESFYLQYGFKVLDVDSIKLRRLFLPIKTLETMF